MPFNPKHAWLSPKPRHLAFCILPCGNESEVDRLVQRKFAFQGIRHLAIADGAKSWRAPGHTGFEQPTHFVSPSIVNHATNARFDPANQLFSAYIDRNFRLYRQPSRTASRLARQSSLLEKS